MKIPTVLLALGGLALLAAGCKPDPGPGGKASIVGTAMHHSLPIPYTRVFIKYDATTSPGTDPTQYDDSTVAGSDARFLFEELQKGPYYIYGIGYDSTIDMPVTAGIPVVISEKKETEEVILPVTE